jgi:uncharacterized protein
MKVVGLYRYPVKSLRGHAVGEASIERIGMAGDRRWMVVDQSGQFRTIRQIPAMARVDARVTDDGVALTEATHGSISVKTPTEGPKRDVKIWDDIVPARLADASAGTFLSKVLGQPVELVYFDNPLSRPVDQTFGAADDYTTFADGFPILVTTTGSLDHLNSALASPVGMDRFRPNIVVDTDEAWTDDSWRVIRVGGLRLRIVKPCARCVITTRDQLTGEQPNPREPLFTLGKHHRAKNGGIIFGQNAIPDNAITVSVGDPVEIIESGQSNLR